MSRVHTTINRLLFWTLMFVSLFMLTNIVAYSWPRQVVEANKPTTTKQVYDRGEEVFVTGHTHIFVTGTTNNDVRLQCGQAQYFIKQLNLITKPLDTDYVFSLGLIPYVTSPSPPKCKVVTVTTYNVKYLLMFTRTYQVTFETNEFIVTNNIKEQ